MIPYGFICHRWRENILDDWPQLAVRVSAIWINVRALLHCVFQVNHLSKQVLTHWECIFTVRLAARSDTNHSVLPFLFCSANTRLLGIVWLRSALHRVIPLTSIKAHLGRPFVHETRTWLSGLHGYQKTSLQNPLWEPVCDILFQQIPLYHIQEIKITPLMRLYKYRIRLSTSLSYCAPSLVLAEIFALLFSPCHNRLFV